MDNYVMFPPQPDLAQEVQKMQGTLSRLEKYLAAQTSSAHTQASGAEMEEGRQRNSLLSP